MTVETLEPGTKTLRRRHVLEPYLVKLQEALCLQPRDGTHAPRVTIDGVAMSVDPWVAARMDPRGAEPEGGSGRTELLRQSLALWLKGSMDAKGLRHCVQTGSGNLYALQAELMLDSAFGSALLRELQDSVDGLVKHGELEEAKRFSKFQGQVRCVVRELKKSIADSNGVRADELVEQLTDHEPPREAEGNLHEVDPEYAAPRRRQRPPAPNPVPAVFDTSRPRYWTMTLVVLDAIALVWWLFVAAQHRVLDRTPRLLTPGDFPNVAPLTEVVARPPTLYASIDQKTWSEYDDKQKRRFVDGMGSVLLTNDYGGLLLRTTDGRIVGEWLEVGGTRLLDTEMNARAGPAAVVAVGASVSPQYSRFVP